MGFELVLLTIFVVIWVVAIVALLVGSPLAGLLPLSLYQFYGLAAFLGWLSGNMYAHRSRGAPRSVRRRFWLIYFLGPPGILYLLSSMAPITNQTAVPLAPIYGCGVFAILFLVPLTLRSRRAR